MLGRVEKLETLKHGTETLVREAINAKQADAISVLFRDLQTHTGFGVNENEEYAPGSLLKVCLMMAYLKQAKAQPDILSQAFTYTGSEDANAQESYKPSQSLEAGKSYTVDELIGRTIRYSDNNAANLLVDNINPDVLTETYTALGILRPGFDVYGNNTSVVTYADAFLRLFDASYLNKSLSDKALALLSKTEFTKGIVAGVPENITVAHKFGEKITKDNPAQKQLHDCGITYYPNHPYFLCVMTKGEGNEKQWQAIQTISTEIYRSATRIYR